jgi:hypothetical protein
LDFFEKIVENYLLIKPTSLENSKINPYTAFTHNKNQALVKNSPLPLSTRKHPPAFSLQILPKISLQFLMATFKSLGVNQWLIDQLRELNVKKPSPVQEHCIPQILAGNDVLGCSKTGTGKTLAFAAPILQKV